MNSPVESKWDRSKRLEAAFPAWCAQVASALGGHLTTLSGPEIAARWQIVRLPDGLTFDLHLNGYENKVAVSGVWPKDGKGQTVTPRYAINYNTAAAKIYVGTGRDPKAVAKDITRRFLPTYREQYAACLERVASRNEYQDKVAANTRRIAAVLGVSPDDKYGFRIEDGRGQVFARGQHLAYRGVTVSGDCARFELDLPVDQAEQVLRVLQELAAKETEDQ